MLYYRASLALLCSAGLLAGCGASSPSVVRPGSTTPVTTPVTAPSTAGPSTPSGSTSTSTAVHPTVTVTPSRGLRDGQRVRVSATGFSPDEALQVIQCADKGQATGPGDCNLSGMLAVTSDASGAVAATLTVLRGPFGGNGIVCSASTPCLVSVTQASLSPTEEADAPVSFAAG